MDKEIYQLFLRRAMRRCNIDNFMLLIFTMIMALLAINAIRKHYGWLTPLYVIAALADVLVLIKNLQLKDRLKRDYNRLEKRNGVSPWFWR